MANKILDVRNLRISFRTANGKVQAVRGIDFDLDRGETLAIVGESGSGKSVTARSLLGILAPNAIVESGELIYDGKDLLKLSEEDFHDIRGEKIAMIFQDPLSSLNPIVKVGKQLTEAMIIKGRAKQRKSRHAFNDKLKRINRFMDEASGAENNSAVKQANKRKCADFNTFEYKHTELELKYNNAREFADEALAEIENLLFETEKNVVKNKEIVKRVKDIVRRARKSVQTYVVHDKAEKLLLACDRAVFAAEPIKWCKAGNWGYGELTRYLEEIKGILAEALAFEKPNFFAMGYYLTFAGQPLPVMPVAELNPFLRRYLDEHFMLDFIADLKGALLCSYERSYEAQKSLVAELKKARTYFGEQTLVAKETKEIAKKLISAVERAIDRLSIFKDSTAYTFGSSLRDAVEFYFLSRKRNSKETARFEKQSAKRAAKLAKGKHVDWEVVPADVVEEEVVRDNVVTILNRLIDDYESVPVAAEVNFDERTVAMVDYLKQMASNVVYHVTKSMAKNKALKIMEEVGIPQPRLRYKQYPFQFSGGMRQRIVIAIALSADPDILVCDEPTTALDVTIQSQILELINKLKRERNISVIFITHDLGVVANMADRIAVMYAGKIVEYGTSEEVFYQPAHPYTWALLSSMPDLDTTEKLEAIPGTPPNMIYPPKGDAFAARNKFAMKIDFEQQPPMFKISDSHYASTWLLHPDAPKVEPPKIVTERIERMQKLAAADAADTAEKERNAQAEIAAAHTETQTDNAAERAESAVQSPSEPQTAPVKANASVSKAKDAVKATKSAGKTATKTASSIGKNTAAKSVDKKEKTAEEQKSASKPAAKTAAKTSGAAQTGGAAKTGRAAVKKTSGTDANKTNGGGSDK